MQRPRRRVFKLGPKWKFFWENSICSNFPTTKFF